MGEILSVEDVRDGLEVAGWGVEDLAALAHDLCDEVEALRRELDEALAAIREFVDEAVNGDHFCGGVPTDWTDRFIDLLRETS